MLQTLSPSGIEGERYSFHPWNFLSPARLMGNVIKRMGGRKFHG
jgi:hypothetical protein